MSPPSEQNNALGRTRIVLLVLLTHSAALGQYTIRTIAGGGPPDGSPAQTIGLQPHSVTVDSAGSVYVASGRIFRITPGGSLSVVAGNGGAAGYSGDGVPALTSALWNAVGIAVDSTGSVYFVDSATSRVRRVRAGVITTVAGSGIEGFSGDGGPATAAALRHPDDLALDASGNVYIADRGNARIRRVSTAGIITTVAGTGNVGHSGDGGPAIQADIEVSYIAIGRNGDIFSSDGVGTIRKISSGVITTYAGTGEQGFSGDGGPAKNAMMFYPERMACDSGGNLYVADTHNNRVRKISPDGLITTVAGTGDANYSGDGGLATPAALNFPQAVAADNAGNLYIGDRGNGRIRKVTPAGIVTTFAGNGSNGYSGDGGPATNAQLSGPNDAALDSNGNIYVPDAGNHRVRKISTDGVITTVAGNGIAGYSGDGGPATSARLREPTAVTIDRAGNLYIAGLYDHRIRKVDPSGVISTVAGDGESGSRYPGEYGLATSAQLNHPAGLAVDASGALYVTDSYNCRVRKIVAGLISTVAGNGGCGFSGDGGPASNASLNIPRSVAIDRLGNVYIADYSNARIRKVSPDGIITTIAGKGTWGYSGDGGPAINAAMYPNGVALDHAGNYFILDYNRIRKVSPSGVITSLAGTGWFEFWGDGGPAIHSGIAPGRGISVGSNGILYFGDSANDRVRVLVPPILVQPTSLEFSFRIGSPDPSWQDFVASSSSGVTNITATASSAGGWLAISPPNPRSPGAFSAFINTSSLVEAGVRTGTIHVTAGSQVVDVPVRLVVELSCTSGVTPTGLSAPASGITWGFSVSSTCMWQATSPAPWITVLTSSGIGNGAVSFRVAAITGLPRTGTITAGGNKVFTITQEGLPGLQSGLQFVPILPCRFADTRYGFWMNADETRGFIPSAANRGVPADASAYSLNVTAIPRNGLGYLTLWPAGQPQPLASTMNSFDARVKANAAIVPSGINSAVNVYVTHSSDIVLDINGYFVPGTGRNSFYPVPPCRIADTRLANGPLGGPRIRAQQIRSFPVQASKCGLPVQATAYSMNFTAVPGGPLTYLSVWPKGAAQPLVSTLNAPTGTVTANAAVVPSGADGTIDVFATNNTDLVIDVNGYFAPPGSPGALSFYAVNPCRVVDTRLQSGPFGGPQLSGGQTRSFAVEASGCGVPSSARVYSLNVTVLPWQPLSYLTLWPADVSRPLVSTLNSFDGSVVSNAAIVPASANGQISVFVPNTTHIILDINGYFQ